MLYRCQAVQAVRQVKRPIASAAGKMLLYGALLRCLDPVLTIAAAQGWGRPIFWSPPDKRDEVRGGGACVCADAGMMRRLNTRHRSKAGKLHSCPSVLLLLGAPQHLR